MAIPKVTRLRFAKSRDASALVEYLDQLNKRVQIYQIVHDGTSWYLWFVPNDEGADVPSIDLDE